MFNPFAYQFLFCIGMYVSVRPLRFRRSTAAVAAGLLITGVVAFKLWWVPRLIAEGLWSPMSLLAQAAPWTGKGVLEPLRLAYFLMTAYVVTALTPSDNAFWTRPSLRPVVKTGQHSLEVFCFSIVVTYALGVPLAHYESGPMLTLLVALGGCLLCIAYAYGIAWTKKTVP